MVYLIKMTRGTVPGLILALKRSSGVDGVSPMPACLHPPPLPERTNAQPVNPQKLSLAYVAVTSRISGLPLEKTKGPAGESTKLSLAHVTATSRTRHTGGSTPCADDLTSSPPPPHVLEFTENSCNVMCTKK